MIEFIKEIAFEAGRILSAHFRNITSSDIKEKSKNDYVTMVDIKAEKLLRRRIQEKYPTHTIIGEEEGGVFNKRGFEWIIDPLDGTHNFMHGFPMFCVSIAVAEDGIIKYGVIYDPIHEEMFNAEKGQGAFLNKKKISISKTNDLSRFFLATGYPFRAKPYLELYLEAFKNLFLKTAGMRRAGSAALDLCYTACGRFDAFWEMKLKIWDIAAGALIIEEAGGKVSGFGKNKNFMDTGCIIGSNGIFHEELLKLLETTFNEIKL